MSLLDQRFPWTEFFSVGADRKVEHVESLREIAARIRRTTKRGKQQLPWFKGARFGDIVSIHGSLKTNVNVLTVTALEADYDGNRGIIVTFEEAVEMLRVADVAGLIYSTPSDSPIEPHWRVIAHLSHPYPGEARQALQARLNGLLGGVLDPASFNLSLSYYYGSIPGKPRARVELVDGSLHIDETDIVPIGRHGTNDDDLLGPRPSSGVKPELAEGDAERLLMAVKNDERFEHRGDWRDIGAALHHQFDGGQEGLDLFLKWSKGWHDDDPDYTEATYESFTGGGSRPKTFRWIIQLAGEAGVGPRASEVVPEEVFEDISGQFTDNPHPKPERSEAAARGAAALEQQLAESDPLTLNKEHAIVRVGNKVRILWELPEGGIEFLDRTNFELYYADQQIAVGPRSTIAKTTLWLQHPEARRYIDICFRPEGNVPKGSFNLFRGFGVQPSTDGSCTLLLDHLYENVSQGSDLHFRYLLGWLSDLIQYPGRKPGVAVVLRGLKGVGKDIVGQHLGALFPQAYIAISEMDQLTGKFNSHLAQKLLIHCEEALWAGDKRAESSLKSLITRPSLTLEKKGVDVITVENSSRIFITSNAQWVVPVTADERRFAIYEVGDAHRTDRSYFAAIDRQLRDGGYGRLMHELQSRNLNGFDVGDPPDSIGLSRQKLEGLKGADRFWRETLDSGELPIENNFEEVGDWRAGPVDVSIEAFYQCYKDWWKDTKGFGHGALLGKEEFGRAVSTACPSRQRMRRRAEGGRLTTHRFPPLAQCRQEFADYLRSEIVWAD